MNIAILGIKEMVWLDSGNINIENHKIHYLGLTSGKHKQGMGVILTD